MKLKARILPGTMIKRYLTGQSTKETIGLVIAVLNRSDLQDLLYDALILDADGLHWRWAENLRPLE